MSESTLKYLLEGFNSLSKDYRHVAVKLESRWGTESCHIYLKNLLNKNEEREGFDTDIYSILMIMYMIHLKKYGDFKRPLILSNPNIDLESVGINFVNEFHPSQIGSL